MEREKFGRLLFGAAAFFNLLGAAVLALMPQAVALDLRMPIGAVTTVYGQCFIAFILVFAGMYWFASRDPVAYRPFIAAGAIGKAAVVTIVVCHWLAGDIGPALMEMVAGDLFFAAAFCYYLVPVKQEVAGGGAAREMRRTLSNEST